MYNLYIFTHPGARVGDVLHVLAAVASDVFHMLPEKNRSSFKVNTVRERQG